MPVPTRRTEVSCSPRDTCRMAELVAGLTGDSIL